MKPLHAPSLLLCLALTLMIQAPARASGDVSQAIAFQAMNHSDPSVLPAVQTLIRTGFLDSMINTIRDDERSCSAGMADMGERITCFARDYFKNQYRVAFGEAGTRSPQSIRVEGVQWSPGDRFAEVTVRFRVGGDRGTRTANCTAKARVDVQMWVMQKIDRSC